MISTEEIVDLSEFLTREGFKPSPYQIFAAQQILLSESVQDTGAGSLVRLSTLLGPIFCTTPEEQQKFEGLYLRWIRQRSHRPNTLARPQGPGLPPPDIPTSHWRMKVAVAGLLILPLLTAWFLWQDFRLRHLEGRVVFDTQPIPQTKVQLGGKTATTNSQGQFTLPFYAKDMPV